MRECTRDAPAMRLGACVDGGARTPPAPLGGMTRRDNKPLFRCTNVARVALLDARGRHMRSAATPSEQLLWSRLSGRKLGVTFRRQVPLLGRFIADFLAPTQRLVIEVDGAYHEQRARADAIRDAVLGRAGYRVLHFEALRVEREIETVIARIKAEL